MARGNQRDLARAKNLKKQGEKRNKNTMSGAEMAKDKEKVAAMMREKQAAADAKKAAGSSTEGRAK